MYCKLYFGFGGHRVISLSRQDACRYHDWTPDDLHRQLCRARYLGGVGMPSQRRASEVQSEVSARQGRQGATAVEVVEVVEVNQRIF